MAGEAGHSLAAKLEEFASSRSFTGKGPLCVALVVTEHARERGLPLDPDQLVTKSGGQVRGLGQSQVQKILARHGIERVLAAEGGRTSRGSLGNMRAYVRFLNQLSQEAHLESVEAFWVHRVRDFFAGQPLRIKLDPGMGIQAVVRALMDQAAKREMEYTGRWYVGTMIEHLVGAVIDCGFGLGAVSHHSSSSADQPSGRSGDFHLDATVVHVTTSPGEAVIRRCAANLEAGLRPVLVVRGRSVGTATDLANNAGIEDRVDVLPVEQLVTLAVFGSRAFGVRERRDALSKIVERYNDIVGEVETDPSLRIALS